MKIEADRKCKKNENASEGFLSGVLILSISTVVVKIIGLAYKIPMLAKLGSAGMGYFNSAYEVYAVLCVMATAGLPVALSMMIAAAKENQGFGRIRQVDRSARRLFLGIGIVGSLILLLFSKPISLAMGNDDAYLCILAVAPALVLACYSGAVRGFFQGFHRMGPTAVSQLLEAGGKLIFGVWFASLAIQRGYSTPKIAAFAMLGVTAGMVLSAAYLFAVKRSFRLGGRESYSENGRVLRQLLQIAFPITMGAVLLSGTKVVDMSVMMHRLHAIGKTAYEANEIYGAYTTLAVPVFSLIPSLITPISLVLIPKLSAVLESKNRTMEASLCEESIRLTVLFSMPASFGILMFSRPILELLFWNQNAAIDMAEPLLAILGASILFSGMITTTNAILQAYRHTVLPMISMLIGVLLKIALAYILIGIPTIGALGAPISTFLCNLTITCFNLYFLRRCVPSGFKTKGMLAIYGKPLVASCISVSVSSLIYPWLGRNGERNIIASLAAISFAAVAYLVLVIAMRIVTKEDLSRLPFGSKLLKKVYLLKERTE